MTCYNEGTCTSFLQYGYPVVAEDSLCLQTSLEAGYKTSENSSLISKLMTLSDSPSKRCKLVLQTRPPGHLLKALDIPLTDGLSSSSWAMSSSLAIPGSAAKTGLSQDSVYRHSNIPNPARLLSSGTLPSL